MRRFQAMEYGDAGETVRWMKYWIVFGVLRAMENIGANLIWWLRGYFFLRVSNMYKIQFR